MAHRLKITQINTFQKVRKLSACCIDHSTSNCPSSRMFFEELPPESLHAVACPYLIGGLAPYLMGGDSLIYF